jgi:hypothetical protein
MTEPAHPPVDAPPRPKPRYDPGQDFLILLIVVMCSIISIKLVVEFMEWNKLQTCISSGRNCAPRVQGPQS